jgi:DNA-binding transcriptional LysR family regulator
MNGRLVAPLAGRSVDITYVGHHLVYPRETRQGSLLKTFADWLLDELAR